MAAFGVIDSLKVRMILAARAVNRASIERWSRRTFRRSLPEVAGLPRLVPAPERYKSGLLPRALLVPEAIPAEVGLGLPYVAPYYYLSGAVFTLVEYLPLDHALPWAPDDWYNGLFRPHPEGWDDVDSDDGYTALRVQGPNPFLLQRDPAEEGRFVIDYGPYFDGVCERVVCAFRVVDGALRPESITQGDRAVRPGEPGWERAKFVANALDARFTVFLRHLEHTHLITGQFFALSAFVLPPKHGLRAFLELFTYSTLVINDFAFRLLVTPESYFLASHFLAEEHVKRIFENFLPTYRLEQLMPRKDIAARGIDQIPGHPYVEDAPEIWDTLDVFVRGYVEGLYPDEGALAADPAVTAWYTQLLAWLPNRPIAEHPMTRASVIETLTALVYLNASHEIAGDFSPYAMSQDPEQKRLIDFANVLDDRGEPARAADVFLFDQGAWAGRFDNAGNFLVGLDVDRAIPDPALREAVRGLQGALSVLDDRLRARNAARRIPFLRLQPRKWKASISF